MPNETDPPAPLTAEELDLEPLKPCPFCGGSETELFGGWGDNDCTLWCITCQICGSDGPAADNAVDAHMQWNVNRLADEAAARRVAELERALRPFVEALEGAEAYERSLAEGAAKIGYGFKADHKARHMTALSSVQPEHLAAAREALKEKP